MDKVLFAESIKSCSEEQLRERVETEHLDFRVGYTAMIADFIPFIFDAKDDLTLKIFQSSIQEKIRARMKQDQ